MAAFRFRITDILFVTAAIAAGCAAAQIPVYSWFGGGFVTVCLLVIAVTGRECITLRKSSQSATELSADQRRELKFLAWGRFAVVVVLALVLSLDLMARAEVIRLPETEGFENAGQRARGALIDLSLLICIVSPTFAPRTVRTSRWRSAVDYCVFGLAAVLALLILTQATFIHFLVYLAVRGVEQARMWQPPQPLASESRFAYLLVTHALGVLLIVGVVHFAATHWPARRLRNGLLFAATVGLGALGWSAARLAAVDLPEISPAMRDAIEIGPMHRWIATAFLTVTACVVWSYLVVRRSRLSEPATRVPVPDAWHTRVLAPAMVVALYTLNAAFLANYFIYEAPFGTLGDLLISTLATTDYQLSIAVWVAAALQLYRVWRNRKSAPKVELHGLPRAQFLTLALFNVALAAVGGFVIAWLSFALWLTPWYRWVG